MVLVVGALAGMTARTGHHLAGLRVEDICADRMGERSVPLVTFTTDRIDRALEHGGMVRSMGGMAVVAGIGPHVAEFCRIVPLESRFVAETADMTFLALEQPLIIAGVGGMAGHTAIIFVTDQVIMG